MKDSNKELLRVELPEQTNKDGISFVKFIYPEDVIDFFSMASDEAINIVLRECFNAELKYELNNEGEMEKYLQFSCDKLKGPEE
jgi:hypothetical protein